jgi:alpha-D-ribose 1-methylphosphonate 5-triphosphate synthase subunit PhnG
MTVRDQEQQARRHWLAVLARAGRAQLEDAVRAHAPAPAAEPVRPPEVGMTMVRGRVGGTGDAFNLGEATVTRCAVRIGEHLGVGYTLGRDTRKAELIATLDALLQDEARRAPLRRDVVEPLARAQAQARKAASRAAAASRVQFFTLVRGEAA